MKKQLDIKKLLILNLPYLLMGLFATNFGEAWRMAQGADASAKMLSFFSTLPVALASWWPSLHPLDLLVGLCCGAGLRLAVYLKSKNAKKYRHGMEYGSARWGTHEDIAPYVDPVFQNNVILTKTESLTMNSRPTGIPEQCDSDENREPDHEQPPERPQDCQKQKCAGDRRLRFR